MFKDSDFNQDAHSMIHPSDFARLEKKVDKLADHLNRLLVFEERQVTQGTRIGELEKSLASMETAHAALEKKLDQWINRGMGIWAFVVAIWTLVEFLGRNGFIKFGG